MAQAPASHRGAFARQQPLALLALAGVALLAGLFVYIVDRPAAHAIWIPAIGLPAAGRQFGAAGDWLPSFLHALAFSLLTASLWRAGSRAAYAACAAWALVDLAFEAGQHAQLKAPLAVALRHSAAPAELTEPLAGYLLRGTFDVADIAAVLAGSLCAAAVLMLLAERPRPKGDLT